MSGESPQWIGLEQLSKDTEGQKVVRKMPDSTLWRKINNQEKFYLALKGADGDRKHAVRGGGEKYHKDYDHRHAKVWGNNENSLLVL